jgi:hypothetical protein
MTGLSLTVASKYLSRKHCKSSHPVCALAIPLKRPTSRAQALRNGYLNASRRHQSHEGVASTLRQCIFLLHHVFPIHLCVKRQRPTHYLIPGYAAIPRDHYKKDLTLRAMRLCELPPEIIDAFVDHLRYDKHALRACASAHRLFLSRCRYHLLRSIRLRRSAQTVRFVQLIERFPRTASFIVSLAIEYDSPLTASLVEKSKLPSLERLSLRAASATSTLRWLKSTPSAGITSLALRSCCFDDMAHLRLYIGRFQGLRYLRMHSIRIKRSESAVSEELPEGLTTVSLCRSNASVLVPWTPKMPATLSLSLHGSQYIDTSYANLVRGMASGLRILHVKLASVADNDDPRGKSTAHITYS